MNTPLRIASPEQLRADALLTAEEAAAARARAYLIQGAAHVAQSILGMGSPGDARALIEGLMPDDLPEHLTEAHILKTYADKGA
jgi:hypothetical protein